jgi:hypothetical protein
MNTVAEIKDFMMKLNILNIKFNLKTDPQYQKVKIALFYVVLLLL